MPRKRKTALPSGAKPHPRITWRDQGGQLRAYAYLKDLGGGREALKAPGDTHASTDPVIAEALLNQRISELMEQRRAKVLLRLDPDADLAAFSIHHLEEKEEAYRERAEEEDAEVSTWAEQWLATSETYLTRAVAFFTVHQFAINGAELPDPKPRNLASIGVTDVQAYLKWLKIQPNGRGGYLGRSSRRLHLTVLSNMIDRAISEGKLPLGSNPVTALIDKPTSPRSRTIWLEVDELALLLESARTLREFGPTYGGRPLECAYELLATFILTGAREDEIRRLRTRHVRFRDQTIHIPGTKTQTSDRIIPMHPQLREILQAYVERLGRGRDDLLFTNAAGDPFGDWRKTLDTIAVRAGFKQGKIRTRVFRTSYITHRLACIDQGAFIEPYKVAREVGHKSMNTTLWIYGRVQLRRVRMEELAFRVTAIGPDLEDRLHVLYSPPTPGERAGAKDSAELVARFLSATQEMSTGEMVAVTGLSKATIKRLRAGGFAVLQAKTSNRLRAFLEPETVPQPPHLMAPRRTGPRRAASRRG
ncbi:integrase [Longimicrobium terrae]|uniref:Integrase n=1 Tax=Longimicrobium terrae TaxID=1639882 RepID=A0A841GRL5_9BACT|nr:integrase [Longimicrobium terrae]